jgi:hypothetical protein
MEVQELMALYLGMQQVVAVGEAVGQPQAHEAAHNNLLQHQVVLEIMVELVVAFIGVQVEVAEQVQLALMLLDLATVVQVVLENNTV